MAKFLVTKKVVRKEEHNIYLNLDHILYAKPIASDAIEITLTSGESMVIKSTLKDLT